LHPRARRRSTWLRGLVLTYAACIVVIEISRRLGPERWWLTCLNLYLPQGAWALPGVLLLLLSLVLDRRFVLVPALCLAWVMGPIMGLCFAIVRPSAPPESRFRVMTYNVKYGRGDTRTLTEEVLAADPDLLLIQDAEHRVTTYPPFAAFLRTRHVETKGLYLVASRYPLSPVEFRPMGSDWYVRTRVESASFPLAVYNVHLMTPRDGLVAVREWSWEGVSELMDGARERLAQVAQLNADLDREVGPVLLGGDLNAPPESLVLRRLRSNRLRDAFSAAGRGYGYTYGHLLKPYVSYMRIDHILFSRELVALDSWVGGRPGSAHLPVVADLARAGS
jgi:endonuclease/exonuclease/phosphatase (EEP) superfamily protein YafD